MFMMWRARVCHFLFYERTSILQHQSKIKSLPISKQGQMSNKIKAWIKLIKRYRLKTISKYYSIL